MASPVIATRATSTTPTASTNHVVTLASGIAAGDLILIISAKGNIGTAWNAHADYTALENTAGSFRTGVFYRWAAGGETNPTFTTSTPDRDATVCLRITGAENPATQPPVAASPATGSSVNPNPPSITPPSSKDYLFIAACSSGGEQADDGTYCTAFPTNYTYTQDERACGTAGTNLGGLIAVATRQLTTGSAEDPGTFTVSENTTWFANTIIIHPGAPAAPAEAYRRMATWGRRQGRR